MQKAREMLVGFNASTNSFRDTMAADVVPVGLAVVAAFIIYFGRHLPPNSHLKLLTGLLLPPTILSLYLSGTRQDEKIKKLYTNEKVHLDALHAIKVPHPALVMNAEKMTATRTQAPGMAVENERGNLNGRIGRDAVARDMHRTTERIEQRTNTHPGVRNSNGYAPSRQGEAQLIEGKSHMEDNASFYAHSSTDRSQQRTNMPTGHTFNRVQSADAPGDMQLTSMAADNGQRVQMDYSNTNAPTASAGGGGAAAPVVAPPRGDSLSQLFMDTAVSTDKSDNDVEGMKEGRSS
jgi:hypothetical protein